MDLIVSVPEFTYLLYEWVSVTTVTCRHCNNMTVILMTVALDLRQTKPKHWIGKILVRHLASAGWFELRQLIIRHITMNIDVKKKTVPAF